MISATVSIYNLDVATFSLRLAQLFDVVQVCYPDHLQVFLAPNRRYLTPSLVTSDLNVLSVHNNDKY